MGVACEEAEQLRNRRQQWALGAGGGIVEEPAEEGRVEREPTLHLGGGGGAEAGLLLKRREPHRIDHEHLEAVGFLGRHSRHGRLAPPHSDLAEHGGRGEHGHLSRLRGVAGMHHDQGCGGGEHDVHLA